MTTAIFATSTSTPGSMLGASWHGQHVKQRGSPPSATVELKHASLSSDGYVRHIGVGGNQSDLNINNNNSNSSFISNESQDGQQQQQHVQKPNNNGPTTATKTSQVSILAGKYMLLPASTSSPGSVQQGSSKSEFNCVNIQTKEQFTCKIVPRNPKGLAMLAAYHRLEESSQFVNQVVEAILTPKMIYFIMPRNYGNVHLYLLANRCLKEPEAANIFKQMVSIVQFCHSKGVVLRDIKMGRFVFVDQSRTVVKLESLEDAVLLIDPNNDHLDDKHGCPNYVSPEKAEILRKPTTKYPGKASDIWTLGIMLYTMLVGRYPFNDADNFKLFNKIRTENFPIPQRLSGPASTLIKALLQKSPAGRPCCKDILRSCWFKLHCVPTSELISMPGACSAWESEATSEHIIPDSESKKSLCERITDQVVPML